MANEINIQNIINFSKGSASVTTSSNGTVTVAGTNYLKKTVSIATTDTTVDITGLASIGWVAFKNLDPTNYVTFGSDGAVYPVKCAVGEPAAVMRWSGATIHAIANTAACRVEVTIIET